MASDMATLRNPLGTRDLFGRELSVRDYIIKIVTEAFERYGGNKIETPVLECLTSITALYGDEFNKLVYTLDDGGDKLFMRYDLTLPLARFVNMNGLKQFRRYQIAKVYRKDNPQISKGRYREFYQCDFDIIGDDQGTRLYQYEVLDLFDNVLTKLLGDKFKIKVNDRRFLIELLLTLGVPDDKINCVSCTLDKLDKKTVEEIKIELSQKEVSAKIINNIFEVYEQFAKCVTTDEKIAYFTEKKIISVSFVSSLFGVISSNKIQFDPFLVRGMDYYTGLIFEAEYEDKELMPSSIGGGGMYNKMISAIDPHNNGEQISAVGLSLGLERIATILESDTDKQYSEQNKFEIYVATIGKNMADERFKLVSKLRRMGYKVTMSHLANPKMRPQFDTVFELKIPIMLIMGDQELLTKTIKIKDVDKSIEMSLEISKLGEFLDVFFKKN